MNVQINVMWSCRSLLIDELRKCTCKGNKLPLDNNKIQINCHRDREGKREKNLYVVSF